MSVSGLTLYFDAEDRDAAELIGRACERSVRLNQEHWGLDTPDDFRVYVMTSWLHFFFHSAPWPWRILLALTLPLWLIRIPKLWRFAGGWEQRYGKRRAVGIKPPRLMEQADRSMGLRIFVPEADIDEKVERVTCHELTHAFTTHLKLPNWLKEGIAMVTVDEFAGKPTVLFETLGSLERSSGQESARSLQRLALEDPDALAYLYVRGYWITRYLEETRPALLRGLLTKRYPHEELESRVAAALDMESDEFWSNIDRLVVSHFNQEEPDQGN